jgi:hypothetical protein
MLGTNNRPREHNSVDMTLPDLNLRVEIFYLFVPISNLNRSISNQWLIYVTMLNWMLLLVHVTQIRIMYSLYL